MRTIRSAACECRVAVVTGMAFEAQIASGPGVITICASHSGTLDAHLKKRISLGCVGIVSFGIAGGLSSNLKSGDCVIARSVVTANGSHDADPEWSLRLMAAIPGAIYADIASVERPIATPERKHLLGEATGAVAVDMESSISVALATAHSLPFAAVRVIADPSHRGLPPAALLPMLLDGRPDRSGVLRSVRAKPGQLSELIRLAFDVRKARIALQRSRKFIGADFAFAEPAAFATLDRSVNITGPCLQAPIGGPFRVAAV